MEDVIVARYSSCKNGKYAGTGKNIARLKMGSRTEPDPTTTAAPCCRSTGTCTVLVPGTVSTYVRVVNKQLQVSTHSTYVYLRTDITTNAPRADIIPHPYTHYLVQVPGTVR
jgi:hypothetical protein